MGKFRVEDLVVMTKADAEGLLAAIQKIKAAAPTDATTGFPAAFTTAIAEGAAQLDERGWDARPNDLSEALMEADGPWKEGFRLDLVWHVHNDVVDSRRRWPRWTGDRPQDQPALTGLLAAISDVDDRLTEIVADATTLTQYDDVRELVEEALKHVAVGKCVDFTALAAAYIDSATTRLELLKQLDNDADFVGAVDTTHGLIYKISADPAFRLFTYVSPVVFFGLAGGALIGITALHGLIAGWPTQLWQVAVTKAGQVEHLSSWHKLLGPYCLVIAGVIAHLVVETLKQSQAGTPIIAFNGLLNWLHLRWLGLAASYLPVLVVVVGLSLLGVGDKGHDLTLWVAAGYSVDSVAGLILNRFDTGAGLFTQLKTIVQPPKQK